ncbi:MAG: hypothetical protein GY866_41080 [Proteobacteria bacterium]|nr:hypothetical protein [Pseudomonadota bacterium]
MNLLEKLNRPESRKLEIKRQLPGKSDLLKTIVAFSNGAGGELILGVSEKNRDVVGIKEPLLLEERISQLIRDNVRPFVSPYISILNVAGKEILIVRILPGNNKPYYKKSSGMEKGVYIRIRSTNRQATPETLDELRRQSRGIAFETEIDATKTIADFENESVSMFLESIGQNGYTNETLTEWKMLQHDSGEYFPTIAGLVLFGKKGLIDLDFASIRITKYRGITLSDILETREYSVPIVTKVDDISHRVCDFLRKEPHLEGTRQLERTVIPFFAVREAVVNAIVHRDYSMRGSSIKINVFDDRLEIISPGILFGSLDISDVGTGLSECRNRSIVRVFRRLNLMETLGTGIARIFELFEKRELKRPQFQEQGRFFKAILPQEKAYTTNEDKLCDIIGKVESTRASEMARQMNLHHNTILKYLNKLIGEGRIQKTGSGRNTLYHTV